MLRCNIVGYRSYCYFKSTASRKLMFRSFSNLSVTSPTSQLILQPFRRFTYVTAHSPTLPLLHLRHSSFFNPSFAFLTSQALHLIHLASRPWAAGPTLAQRGRKGRLTPMRHVASRCVASRCGHFFIMYFKWHLAKASESMRRVAARCVAERIVRRE